MFSVYIRYMYTQRLTLVRGIFGEGKFGRLFSGGENRQIPLDYSTMIGVVVLVVLLINSEKSPGTIRDSVE